MLPLPFVRFSRSEPLRVLLIMHGSCMNLNTNYFIPCRYNRRTCRSLTVAGSVRCSEAIFDIFSPGSSQHPVNNPAARNGTFSGKLSHIYSLRHCFLLHFIDIVRLTQRNYTVNRVSYKCLGVFNAQFFNMLISHIHPQ